MSQPKEGLLRKGVITDEQFDALLEQIAKLVETAKTVKEAALSVCERTRLVAPRTGSVD